MERQYLNFNDKLQFLKFLMNYKGDIEWDKIKYSPEDIMNSIFEDCIRDNEKEFDCVKGDENLPGCYDDYHTEENKDNNILKEVKVKLEELIDELYDDEDDDDMLIQDHYDDFDIDVYAN